MQLTFFCGTKVQYKRCDKKVKWREKTWFLQMAPKFSSNDTPCVNGEKWERQKRSKKENRKTINLSGKYLRK